MLFFRNLSSKQKSLLLEFARLESDRQGSVDGLDDGRTASTDDEEGKEESAETKEGGGDDKSGFKFKKWFTS